MIHTHPVRSQDAHPGGPCPRLDLALKRCRRRVTRLAESPREKVEETHPPCLALLDQFKHPGRRDARDDQVHLARHCFKSRVGAVARDLVRLRVDWIDRARKAEFAH
ncbi:MAG: hypothetical protein DYG91_03975 [Chloroflexi bacterium CFX7]|nr:hypothetical protein [Chloroflexi bacterium CFX7]